MADGTGPASSRTPYPTAEQAGPQVLRAPVAAALSSPPPDPLPGLAAALRGLTHEAARFPQLIIIYDQIPDRRRGRGFATGIHLNEALEWSKRPGPPQSSRSSSSRSLRSCWPMAAWRWWWANSTYAHIGRLPNPDNDARDMSAALRRLGFEVTTELNADRVELTEALRAFTRQERGGGRLAGVLRGHGIEMDGVNYLVPVDARLERDIDVRFETVTVDDLLVST